MIIDHYHTRYVYDGEAEPEPDGPCVCCKPGVEYAEDLPCSTATRDPQTGRLAMWTVIPVLAK